jgi:hypothetical protein
MAQAWCASTVPTPDELFDVDRLVAAGFDNGSLEALKRYGLWGVE